MPRRRLTLGPKRIAPRLASGKSRVPFGHGLPEEVKEGLRAIAAAEHASMSWVMERIIIEYFGMDTPDYAPRKTPLGDA